MALKEQLPTPFLLSTAVSFTMIKVCNFKRLLWCCLFIMKLCFWLHVRSTAWGLWNFAIAFYSAPDNLSVFDFVWNLISSDEIPAMALLWVVALVSRECELQLTVFVCFHFSLQCQSWGEVSPQSRWVTQLPGGCALGTSTKRCLNSGLTSAEAQHLQNLDFPHL